MANGSTTVISFGGSLVAPGPRPKNPSWIDQKVLVDLIQLLKNLCDNHNRRFVVTVGGGKINSHYVEALRKMSGKNPIDDRLIDILGISATRFNATLLWTLLYQAGLAYKEVVDDPTLRLVVFKPVIVGCGWLPGCSTDKDAVLWAINRGAKVVINASNISHVYDQDPREHDDAKIITQISWPDFRKIIGSKWTPRMNTPFDPVAAKLAEQHKIKVLVLDGRDMDNLRNAIEGKDFIGTTIG